MNIKEYHEAISENLISSSKLLDYYLNRIEMYEEKLNSIIVVNPNVRQEAKDCDEYYKKNGFKGKMHGVFLLVKDNFETKELFTTAGSLSLKDYQANRDAFILKRLLDEGAIVLAKTNLHEFAVWGETISSILGQTKNPYDLTRTPGGSSGGTGAAVAADFGMVGIGTDTINSVRSPSSANSLYGLRPSMGMLSRSGIVPYSLTQDTAGPMTKNVYDLSLMMDIMSGYDKEDTITAWSKGANYNKKILNENFSGIRVGVLRSFFGKEDKHIQVNREVEKAISIFRDNGADIVEISDKIDSIYLSSDVSVHLYDLVDDLDNYLINNNTPVKSVDEILDSGNHHEGIKDNLIKAMNLSKDSLDYKNRLYLANKLKTQIMDIFARKNIDILLFPHQQQLVCKIGENQLERNGVLASVTGFPSLCMPAGFSDRNQDAPIGVPVGVEIFGRPFSDYFMIEIAKIYESFYGERKKPIIE